MAIFMLSLGPASAQEMQNTQEITDYKKNDIEANAFAPTTFSFDLDFHQQVMEFDKYPNLNLNQPLSPAHAYKIKTSGDYHWRHLTLYGIGDRDIMMGLMDRQDAEVGFVYHKDKVFFNVGLMASVYNFNPLAGPQGSPIHNQFGIRGNIRYDFNENVSVTVYGQYVNHPFYHSMASFPYIATSSFGGYLTLQNEKFGMDLGVNNYFDPFSRSWKTDPIVRPTYKIGKVKIGMDVGPLMKEGILKLAGKKRAAGPIIMPPN